jgi:geranylgeranyl reductase family protein
VTPGHLDCKPQPADLVVIGAGPAGCSAAITAARDGQKVVMVDKARFPRDKCCGDGLTAGALRHLAELGVEVDSLATFTRSTALIANSPANREYTFSLRPGLAGVATRRDLDAALVRATMQAGVEVYQASPIQSVEDTGDRLLVEAGGHTFSTAFAVAADGAWSPTRKLVRAERPEGYLGDWYAFRQYFHSTAGLDAMWVGFEADLLPGYVWAFPLAGGLTNVGFGVLRRPGQPTGKLASLWRDILNRPSLRSFLGADAEPISNHKAWPIPTSIAAGPAQAFGGRLLFAGDAMGVGDPMTGEGIGQALASGTLAARTIARQNRKGPGFVARAYRKDLSAGLGLDSAVAGLLRRGLSHRRGAELALALAGQTAIGRDLFARWLFEEWPRSWPLRTS